MECEVAHHKAHEETTIANLPAEILSDVLSYLPRDSHLVQIALVSKRFKDLVEPYHYQSVTLKLLPPENYQGLILEPGNLDRFYRLAKHLTQGPNLCRSVVALCLSVSPRSFQNAFNDQDQLITLLPSLKELTVNPPPPHLNLSTSKRLEILRLDFYNYSEQDGKVIPELDRVDPLEIVARHFWMPTLQSLQFSTLRLRRGRGRWLFPKERYRTSPITDLRVMRCQDHDLGILADILLSVRVLKCFTLECDVPSRSDDSIIDRFSPDWFAQALQPHESTLVDLVIAGSGAASFSEWPLFGSWASYISLKRLSIPETFLAHRHSSTFHEWLPPSLEVLQLQIPWDLDLELLDEDEPFRVERMEHLAENTLACLPALKCVIWWDQRYDSWDSSYFKGDLELEDRMDQLASKFKDVGVEFKSCYSWFFATTPMGKESGRRYLEDAWFY